MAVKKAKKDELDEKVSAPVDVTVDENVSVNENADIEVDETETASDENEIDVVGYTTSDKIDETIEVTVKVEEPTKPDVEVSVEDAVVNTAKKPNGNVKIRMRVDHKCCIAMERYDLKADKVYTVPENVKKILNKAGLLSPI